MITTGFDARVKVQQIVDNQLPEFLVSEAPKAAEFLKQYYISQEYPSGTSDLVNNLEKYVKLDEIFNHSLKMNAGETHFYVTSSPKKTNAHGGHLFKKLKSQCNFRTI